MKRKKTQLTGTNEITDAISELIALQQKVPLTSLTPEQRRQHTGQRLTPKKANLFRNRVATASSNPGVIPATFDLAQLELDAARIIGLLDLQDSLDQFRQSVSDTLLIEGQSAAIRAATAADYVRLAATSAQRTQPITNGRKARPVLVVPPTATTTSTATPATPALSTVKAATDAESKEAAA